MTSLDEQLALFEKEVLSAVVAADTKPLGLKADERPIQAHEIGGSSLSSSAPIMTTKFIPHQLQSKPVGGHPPPHLVRFPPATDSVIESGPTLYAPPTTNKKSKGFGFVSFLKDLANFAFFAFFVCSFLSTAASQTQPTPHEEFDGTRTRISHMEQYYVSYDLRDVLLRLDSDVKNVNTKLEAMAQSMNANYQAMNANFQAMNANFQTVNDNLQKLNEKLDSKLDSSTLYTFYIPFFFFIICLIVAFASLNTAVGQLVLQANVPAAARAPAPFAPNIFQRIFLHPYVRPMARHLPVALVGAIPLAHP